ncbi:MAG: zinc finger domain-containing protein [Candidatus Helarchaeota archaeon]
MFLKRLKFKHGSKKMSSIRINCNGCSRLISPNERAVKFACPNCGKIIIWRCERCKIFARTYRCPNCNFLGP